MIFYKEVLCPISGAFFFSITWRHEGNFRANIGFYSDNSGADLSNIPIALAAK
jgi:hypothetical protein